MKTCGSCGIVAEVYIRTMGAMPPLFSVSIFLTFIIPPGVTHGRELDFRATLLYHTTFLPLTHLLLATREAQFSSAHSRPIAKDFVDGKRSFYNNLFTINDIHATLLRLQHTAAHEVVDDF